MADDDSSPLRASAVADFFMHKMSLQAYRKKKNVHQPEISVPWPAPESIDHEVENSAARSSTIGKNALVRDHRLSQQGPAHSDVRVAAAQQASMSQPPLQQVRSGGGRGPAVAAERHLDYEDGRSNTSSSGRKLVMGASSSSSSRSNNNTNYTDGASLLSVKVRVLETLVANIFDRLLSLRSAYSRVQSASRDVVGESTAFYAADRSMVAELNHLSRLQHSYIERNAIVSGGGRPDDGIVVGGTSSSSDSDDEAAPSIGNPTAAVGTTSLVNSSHRAAPTIIEQYSYRGGGSGNSKLQPPQQPRDGGQLPAKDALLKSYEGLIQNLHVEVRKKNAEVESLKDWLAESTLVKEKLEKKVKILELQQQKKIETTLQNNNGTYNRGGSPRQQGGVGGGGANAAKHDDDSSTDDDGIIVAMVDGGTHTAAAEMLVEGAVQTASEACTSFTKLFMSLMRASASTAAVEWDVEAAFCRSIVDGVSFEQAPSHKRFAFESYVSQHMWHGFESAEFYVGDAISSALITSAADGGAAQQAHRRRCWEEYAAMVGVDAVELITRSAATTVAHQKKKKKEEDDRLADRFMLHQLFATFCQKKFLALLHPKMETSFFGNSDHRRHIMEGKHPNSQLYHSFLRLAKAVWLVHRLAFACHPPASIFQAHRAMPFSPRFMHSVLDVVPATTTQPQVVAFGITPGFLIGADIVIKCEVYLQQP